MCIRDSFQCWVGMQDCSTTLRRMYLSPERTVYPDFTLKTAILVQTDVYKRQHPHTRMIAVTANHITDITIYSLGKNRFIIPELPSRSIDNNKDVYKRQMWDPEKGGGEGSGYPLNRVITIGFNANF